MRYNFVTEGERLFYEYLRSQGVSDDDIEFEKEHQGIAKRPDFSLRLNNEECIFDVKDFEAKEIKQGYFLSADEYGPLRAKIEEGRKQFREFKDKCCCLVLFNQGNYDVDLTEPDIMFGAMYGDIGIVIDFDREKGEAIPSTARYGYLKDGKMVRPRTGDPQNTTISALITLRYVPTGRLRFEHFLKSLSRSELEDPEIKADLDADEVNLGVIVWENVDARIPFPRELLQGDYDIRFEYDGSNLRRVFAGTIIGELVPDPFMAQE